MYFSIFPLAKMLLNTDTTSENVREITTGIISLPAQTAVKEREKVSVQHVFLPAHRLIDRLIGCFQGKRFSFHLPNYTFLKDEGIGKELAL